MIKLIYFILIFIIFFIIYYFVCLLKHGANKIQKISEVVFLENKYQLDLKNTNIHKLFIFICLGNSFIISLTSIISFFFTSIPLIIGISIILLFSQIYIFYMFIFKILIKRGIFNKKVKRSKIVSSKS